MAAVDKNQAVIDFLLQCSELASNPVFFNFANAKDDNKQIVTTANEKSLNKVFLDGSVMKRYTFTIIDFKSVSYNAIPRPIGTTPYQDENVEDFLQVQTIIDWVTEQADARNYPNFGSDCQIDDMRVLTENPSLNGVDTTIQPALAKYSVSIQIDYIDESKKIWR